MIGLLQRVSRADVHVDGRRVAAIGKGLMVLVGVEKDDTPSQAERLAERLLGYRVFPDEEGRMNLSVTDIGGELLLVPQFTLAADTKKGMRPGFARAATPEHGTAMFDLLVKCAREHLDAVQTGEFGAMMEVGLVNDGPVTFWLRTTAN